MSTDQQQPQAQQPCNGHVVECGTCSGTGRFAGLTCHVCNGVGHDLLK